MSRPSGYDAVVVGSGPNGLAAAIELARAGRRVLVLEAEESIGGGCRTFELTLPGFRHDICSAIHPLALASPFFRELDLERRGVAWIHPGVPLAHPLDDGTAVVLRRSVRETAEGLGRDRRSYERLMQPLVDAGDELMGEVLGPLRVPHHPVALARFGLRGLRPASGLARRTFAGEPARALFAGVAAHSILPLEQPLSAAFGLGLALLGHLVGWPLAAGGSGAIAEGLAGSLRELGGEIETGHRVDSMEELPPARSVVFDLTPRQVLRVAGSRLPDGYRRRLERFRYGPGVFKLDWALDGPIPWKASECADAGTVHVGGTLEVGSPGTELEFAL